MKCLEYMGAQLLREGGVPCPEGVVLSAGDDRETKDAALRGRPYPCVLKAQVETGGRGKAGGIRTAESPEQALTELDELFALTINDLPVRHVYAVPKIDIREEWYLSFLLDRDRRCPLLIFSPHGGMDIETIAAEHPNAVARVEIDPLLGLQPWHVASAAASTGLDTAHIKPLTRLATALYTLFSQRDAMLVEINPLVLTGEGELMALDAKVTVDDSALARQDTVRAFRDALDEEPLVLEARSYRFLYIPIEEGGQAAVMSNGSGMIMSCIDLLSKDSVAVGAALDLGGGATADRVEKAVLITFKNSDIRVLFINIFGGITRCDEIAGGIIGALKALDASSALVVRMEGTNKEKGLEMLERVKDRVTRVDNIREGVAAVKERMGSS